MRMILSYTISKRIGGSLLMLTVLLFSCNKFVETDIPANKIEAEKAFASNQTAASVLTRILSDISYSTSTSGNFGLSLMSGLMADELKNYEPTHAYAQEHYMNNVQSRNALFWDQWYQFIYRTNDVLQLLPLSNNVSADVKNQLLGEARFLRAFFYFYLVNYFGDVPLITTTDFNISRLQGRAPVNEVYKLIIEDIKEAIILLNDEYLAANVIDMDMERLRPNKAAAHALLARVYLYTENWPGAEAEATTVINDPRYMLSSPEEVFLRYSEEAIFQLQPLKNGYNTEEGMSYILVGPPDAQSPAAITEELHEIFEPQDLRLQQWISEIDIDGTIFYMPYKYKIGRNVPYPQPELKEYLMVLRLGEQYLIRAEARAQQSNYTGAESAESDINIIRDRAGLDPLVFMGMPESLAAIELERRKELFTEWGHRWLDLKRTGRVDEVMEAVSAIKGSTWQTTKKLYPIPMLDVQNAPNIKQNPGYN